MISLPGPYKGLRIGLFGGSFNPAHTGHMHVAETALKRLHLDWVWWLPARGNPLKREQGDYGARRASAEGFTRTHPRMRLCEVEGERGFTYTADTLAYLRWRCPQAHFVWLMGGDNLQGFHRWSRWQGLAGTLPIAVVARPSEGAWVKTSPFMRRFQRYRLPEHAAPCLAVALPPAWTYIRAPLHPESSTRLRAILNVNH